MLIRPKSSLPLTILLIGALAVFGCKDSDPCPEGFVCTPQTDTGTDATVRDLGEAQDAGFLDSGQDAGTEDTGALDLGDGGVRDGGADAGPICSSPPTPGETGGVCMAGMTCSPGLDCYPEFVMLPDGSPATLGNLFGLFLGTPDPANPGEFIAGAPSDVPLAFAPGGTCSSTCTIGRTGACGDCASCNTSVGPRIFGEVGIDTTIFVPEAGAPGNGGICRAHCEFDATGASNGGCDAGYACDPLTNNCVEACTSDTQCNLIWGQSRAEGLVAAQSQGWTCNLTSGLCEVVSPANAQVNSPCSDDRDCPQHGVCLGGRCATYACLSGDGSPGPVACAERCVAASERGSICVPSCMTPDDCAPQQACSPVGAGARVCLFLCQDDVECKTDERCRPRPPAGPGGEGGGGASCSVYCDPNPFDQIDVPGAIMCAADEFCTAAALGDHGFCNPLDQLCFSDAGCFSDQACEVLGTDLLGRCVDGCSVDADCNGPTEMCVIQMGSVTGVCRAPGGACSASPNLTGTPRQPLLGDAQCIGAEQCSQVQATSPRTVASCVPR